MIENLYLTLANTFLFEGINSQVSVAKTTLDAKVLHIYPSIFLSVYLFIDSMIACLIKSNCLPIYGISLSYDVIVCIWSVGRVFVYYPRISRSSVGDDQSKLGGWVFPLHSFIAPFLINISIFIILLLELHLEYIMAVMNSNSKSFEYVWTSKTIYLLSHRSFFLTTTNILLFPVKLKILLRTYVDY